jgi:DNA repair exonuclease SbcCD ATPase subunit
MVTKKITIEKIYNIFQKYGDLNIKVNTPYGYKQIEACDVTSKNSSVIKTTLKSGKFLETSPHHKLKTKSGKFKNVDSLKTGQLIKTIDGDEEIVACELLTYKKDLYDIQVKDVKQYYSNGIVSHNSSIMDALTFCIFDKFSKGFKASHVLNTQKMSFCCKFNFEVNGIDYFIERHGKSDKKGNVKVDVKFYKKENGDEIPLNGEARRSTNDIIRDYLGSYDDFILTVLSIQNNKAGSFVDLGNTERKDLLCQFMGLTVFDQLYNIANDQFKEINVLLKNFSKDELSQTLSNTLHEIDVNKQSIHDLSILLKRLESEKNEYNSELIELSKNIVKTETFSFEIVKLESDRVEYSDRINSIIDEINNQKENLKYLDTKLITLDESIKKYDGIDYRYQSYTNDLELERSTQNEIEKLKVIIRNKIDKLKKLEDHKYDPNCHYCVNNIFVKDAIATKQELETEKTQAVCIVKKYQTYKANVVAYNDIDQQYKEYQKLLIDRDAIQQHKATLNNSILKLENTLIDLNNKIKIVVDNIDVFYKNKDAIENNNKLLKRVSECGDVVKSLELQIKAANNEFFKASSENGKLEIQHKNISDQLKKLQDLETSYEVYKLYTSVISRDGIPYEVIINTLPKIEKEVNSILQQIVEFTIALQTDGKNITSSIVYDDKQWPLEMGSGMEKFISGLAIRVALINISNLPRPNIICIDEGWGTMDSCNLSSVGNLLSYLKQYFDFIWIISHLDSIKDFVDDSLEITKENGCSKIIFA